MWLQGVLLFLNLTITIEYPVGQSVKQQGSVTSGRSKDCIILSLHLLTVLSIRHTFLNENIRWVQREGLNRANGS